MFGDIHDDRTEVGLYVCFSRCWLYGWPSRIWVASISCQNNNVFRNGPLHACHLHMASYRAGQVSEQDIGIYGHIVKRDRNRILYWLARLACISHADTYAESNHNMFRVVEIYQSPMFRGKQKPHSPTKKKEINTIYCCLFFGAINDILQVTRVQTSATLSWDTFAAKNVLVAASQTNTGMPRVILVVKV